MNELKKINITWKKGDVVFIAATSSSMAKGRRLKVLKLNDNFTFLVGGYRTLHKFIIPIPKNKIKTNSKQNNYIVPDIVTSGRKLNQKPVNTEERHIEMELKKQRQMIEGLTSEVREVKKDGQMIEGLTSEVRELKNMLAVKLNFNTE